MIIGASKKEVIKNREFDTRLKVSEDNALINTLILDKLKYGVCKEAIYNYRKRKEIKIMETKKRIALATPRMMGNELEYVKEAFETNWIAPLGPFVNKFEDIGRGETGESKICAIPPAARAGAD